MEKNKNGKALTHLDAQNDIVHLLPMLAETVIAGLLIEIQRAVQWPTAGAVARRTAAAVAVAAVPVRAGEALPQRAGPKPAHR